ncbi:hypothetical protein JTB14_033511 [Gonioctena quinquepunctata]|nr:hypothetical protein JTB14_033511 [Gonioctena quinquepunctata]
MLAFFSNAIFPRQGDMMASEYYGLPENSIAYSSRNHFHDIHCILKGEIIKEEPIETKCFSEYGVCDESRQKEAEDGKFYEPVSSNYEKNLRESKASLTHSWKKINFDNEGSGYILAADDQEVDQIKKKIKIKNTHEDNFECTDDLLRINADLEMQPLKYEDEIDIVYEDIKPEIHRDKLSGNKSHPNNNAKIVHESCIDFGAGPRQNTTVEEDETDVEKDNKKQFHCEKNPTESKPSLTHFWKNANFDTKGSEYISAADIEQIKKEIKVENPNEDIIGCTDELFTIDADLKKQTLKTEDGIDIIYEDIPKTIANIVPPESLIGR